MRRGGPNCVEAWKQRAERLLSDAHVFYFVSKHPRTRWHIKCVAASSVAYLFSPVQLIPSFIPVIGFLDDFFVLYVAAKVVRRFTPPDLLRECEFAAASATSGKENVRFGVSGSRSFQSAALWLLAAIAASVFVSAYVFHFW